MVKACTEALGLQAMLQDFDVGVDLEIYSDATAAIGMVKRLGLGKVRHLATADIWVQQRARAGAFKLFKLPGAENPGDLMTKHLPAAVRDKHVHKLSWSLVAGRSDIAPRSD